MNGYEVYQFAFSKKNGGVRFILLGLETEEQVENFEQVLEHLGGRLSLIARFSNCESVQSHNSIVEIVSVDEFETLLVTSQKADVPALPAAVDEDTKERFVTTLCALGFRKSDVRDYVESLPAREWDGPADARVRSALAALTA